LDNQSYTSTPYQILNAFSDVKIHNFVVSLRCNNIFNQKYFIPAGVSGTTPTYYVGQLANYSISLKVKI
jgi:outer membrane receptor protein involved in Fe transport